MPDLSPQPGAENKPGSEICKSCNQPIAGRYYRVKGAITCEACAAPLNEPPPEDTASAYFRGLLFGFGGALLASGLLFLFWIGAGFVIGRAFDIEGTLGVVIGAGCLIGAMVIVPLVSVGIGMLTGGAMMAGSRGACGPRYQISAAVLAGVAVLASSLPLGFDVDAMFGVLLVLAISVPVAWRVTRIPDNEVLGPFSLSDSSAALPPA